MLRCAVSEPRPYPLPRKLRASEVREGSRWELSDGEARISHRWAGIFALTQDMLLLVGPVPGRDQAWIAAGYSGHGNVMGFGCGTLVADAMLGSDSDLLRLFDPARMAA